MTEMVRDVVEGRAYYMPRSDHLQFAITEDGMTDKATTEYLTIPEFPLMPGMSSSYKDSHSRSWDRPDDPLPAPPEAPERYAEALAGRLRLIAHYQAMLVHPDARKVYDQNPGLLDKVMNAVEVLAETTLVTWDEITAYGNAFADRLEVVDREGRWTWRYKDGREHA